MPSHFTLGLHPEESNDSDMTPRPLDEIYATPDEAAVAEVSVPLLPCLPPTALDNIWQSDMITKFHDVDGRKKWRCCHCNNDWYEWNATKALSHVVGSGLDVAACKGSITNQFKEAYVELFRSKNQGKSAKQQFIAKMHQSLNTTDDRTLEYYKASKPSNKRYTQ